MSKNEQVREAITHELKCHPGPFQAVKRGDKPFEWRKDDRDYRVGDTLRLLEWEPLTMWGHKHGVPHTIEPHYTGDECYRRVTYIIREGFGIPEGYCIIGLKDMEAQEPVAWMAVIRYPDGDDSLVYGSTREGAVQMGYERTRVTGTVVRVAPLYAERSKRPPTVQGPPMITVDGAMEAMARHYFDYHQHPIGHKGNALYDALHKALTAAANNNTNDNG